MRLRQAKKLILTERKGHQAAFVFVPVTSFDAALHCLLRRFELNGLIRLLDRRISKAHETNPY